MIEIWKEIKGFEKLYEVSTFGRIKRLPKKVHNNGLKNKNKYFISKEKIIKTSNISKGYKGVTLTKDKKRYPKKVHRLVAEAFIPNPENKSQVNHKDGNKANNKIDNLEWCTNKENVIHAYKLGLNSILKLTEAKKKPIILINDKNNKIKEYNSIKEAAQELNLYNSNISKVCNGKLKHTGGYAFIFRKDFYKNGE